MKRIILVLVTGVGLSISSAYFGFNNSLKSNAASSNDSIEVAAEWANESISVEDLMTEADLVVIGKTKVKKDKDNKNRTIQPFIDDNSLVYTEYNFKIKYTIKGDESLKNIPLINYGGENTDGKEVNWENIEKFNDEKLYLVFLQKIPLETGVENDPRAGKYRPMNGPEGTYAISAKDKTTIKKLLKQDKINKKDLLEEKLSLSVEEEVLNIQSKVIQEGLKGILD